MMADDGCIMVQDAKLLAHRPAAKAFNEQMDLTAPIIKPNLVMVTPNSPLVWRVGAQWETILSRF